MMKRIRAGLACAIALLSTFGAPVTLAQQLSPSRQEIEQAADVIATDCLNHSPIGDQTTPANAFSYDHSKVCSCVRQAVLDADPRVLTQGSRADGFRLLRALERRCQSIEFLHAFKHDCPMIVQRTVRGIVDTGAKRLKQAGGVQPLCSCLVQHYTDRPDTQIDSAANLGLDMVASARRISSQVDLNIAMDDDLKTCHWRN